MTIPRPALLRRIQSVVDAAPSRIPVLLGGCGSGRTSLLRELREDHPDGRVLLFAHEATVLLVRYLAERLSEAELMAVARSNAIANASISSWRRVDGELKPESFNHVEHLHREGAPPTRQEDVNAEPV